MNHEIPRAMNSIQPINFIDETAEIGENSTIWHFTVVLAHVKIGKNCSIGSHSEIGRGTVIGDHSRIGTLVFLPSNTIIGKGVFIGPSVVCTDDRHPRAGNFSYSAEPPVIEDGASVGAGVVLLPGVRLGVGCLIGAGAIVSRDVPAHAHVRGEPARVKSYSRIQEETNFDVYAQGIRERVISGEQVRIK